MKPTREVPTEEGVYWFWDKDVEEWEPIKVERSGHKPPYWNSWGLCESCYKGCSDDAIKHVDLNHDATGPCEEDYREGVEFRDGWWWPKRIEPPQEVPE